MQQRDFLVHGVFPVDQILNLVGSRRILLADRIDFRLNIGVLAFQAAELILDLVRLLGGSGLDWNAAQHQRRSQHHA